MKTLFFIFVFFILSIFLSATIINVPADQPTIQAGINVAVYGDTVLVQPDIYIENINYNGKNISVASLFLTTQDTTYISQTIIDGNQDGSVVTFESGEDPSTLITGFTITNGAASYGGGMYCRDESSPSLLNLIITGNSASWGGGISCYNSSSLNQENVTITGNSGGGIYCRDSSPSLENVTLSDNTAYKGGGIYCIFNSSPSLVNVTITGNSAWYGGGGIYCCDNSSPSLVNVTISDNSAYHGGGIGCNTSSPSLNNVTITGNSAWGGGGIYCRNSSPSFSVDNRCSIYSNTIGNARGFGADIFVESGYTIHIIVDTFTVMTPTDYYASPINNFTFDILHSVVDSLINADVYVSVDGDDSNSGTSPDLPFKTIKHALEIIYSDSMNIHTIHLASGVYSNSTNGELFPISWSNYLNLTGNSEDETILDADSTSCVMTFYGVTNAIISNITITNGHAINGGGISCINSSPNLENVTITGNFSCSTGGGGIYCNNSSPSLENMTIANNSASPHGGGIYCESNSNPSLENVTIVDNSTSDNGGGICSVDGSSPSLKNVTITDNSASDNGGGICCYSSSPSLENVTITDNTAGSYGGGIYCRSSSSPILINSILWNDSPEEIYIYSGSVTATYSNIQGGWAGEGNIDNDPLFVGTGVFPYSLLEDSPCIDAGNSEPVYYDPEDPSNPGYALYPAMGTIINDMGAYGGPNAIGWPAVDIEEPIIPNSSSLITHLSNYPNPFNPTTTINYSLKENSTVSLKIYNIKGQKVKQIVNDQLSAGQHSVVWNGKDENNKSVSSGIYFYQLKAGGFEKIKRMILMK